MYSAGSVEYLPKAEEQIELYENMGYGNLPICMAKTQYSFSADPGLKGRNDFTLWCVTELFWEHQLYMLI